MNTLPLVLPELRPALDTFPSADLSAETLPALRNALEDRAAQAFQTAEDFRVTVEQRHIPAGIDDERTLRLLTIRPMQTASTSRPVLLHLHGGGHCAGRPEQNTGDLCRFAQELNCLVISPDYRLTPETPFPGGIEDAYTTLCWIHDNAETLNIRRDQIGVTGESAGRNLAAALCLLARDRNGPSILFQNLIYPMLDDRTLNDAPNPSPTAGEFVWTRTSNTYAWEIFLAPSRPGAEDISQYAAPARATDLSGLPPTIMTVGALDLFLEEDLLYAQRLIRSGVFVELDVVPGAYHAFDVTGAPIAKQTLERRITSMKRFFSPSDD
ncbi:lipase/esterase/arylesterase [Gluconobacter thailandicus F149-1 = NBRC 100600]|uniref:Arylesterase n=1 Tax=Gluconobacter thailandicus NBRC 3257 TaxID=1381097 RepID=A0ABQ0IVD6_GLUTH|nr:alpha/beta hydrolase [Gluconobacter thailandicus]KXV52030.1 arylesterase [Gluconobacter thailandicus]GAC86608.1 arylesterase [Gluconobacter thailandicus NBRC 3255]GAD26169.1 arylesterase [Gluconobacter thailandicus NBRC 3257]GAN92289.1 lipase/esterase/arylesterase [Gluconobacter thailandicus F149-1 = NBRC 100600]GBR58830.1 arylesterase [Gluconobacter thailandicus F149-1 = NBRC 100600]